MLINELNNAITFGSTEQLNDALGKAIGDLVIYNKQGVVDVLNKNGIKVDRNINDEKLIEILSYQIAYQNAAIIHGLYPLIKGIDTYLNDSSTLKPEDFIPSGDITPVGWIGAIVKGVGALVKGVGNIFIAGEKKKQKEERVNAEDEKRQSVALRFIQVAKERQAKQISSGIESVRQEEEQKRKKIYIGFGIGLSALVLVGVLIAISKKSN